MASKLLANVPGFSTTGTAHSLFIETVASDDKAVKLTVVGHDGKKRHASIVMDHDNLDAIIIALQNAKVQTGGGGRMRKPKA